MLKGSRWVWVVIALGAALRLALFAVAQPWTEQGEARLLAGSGDILSFHYLAHDLVLYGRYGGNPQADPYNLDPPSARWATRCLSPSGTGFPNPDSGTL